MHTELYLKLFLMRGGLTPEGSSYYSKLDAGPAVVKQVPTMVRFKNMLDPMSVTAVKRNKLSESFGEGVKLKDVKIEMTDESVTWGIETLLPWLKELRGNLDGNSVTTGSSYANTINVGDFRMGAPK